MGLGPVTIHPTPALVLGGIIAFDLSRFHCKHFRLLAVVRLLIAPP